MEVYTVRVAVKGYVKAYLENNFGSPADIRNDPELLELVGLILRERSVRLDKIVAANFTETMELRISKDLFFRYGCVFTKTETLRFNSFFEKRIKFFARTYISYHNALGVPVAKCIRDFQETFGFPEDVWGYDSIKKDYDRHGRKSDKRMVGNLKAELSKVFMEMLSDLGTPFRVVNSHPALKQIENG